MKGLHRHIIQLIIFSMFVSCNKDYNEEVIGDIFLSVIDTNYYDVPIDMFKMILSDSLERKDYLNNLQDTSYPKDKELIVGIYDKFTLPINFGSDIQFYHDHFFQLVKKETFLIGYDDILSELIESKGITDKTTKYLNISKINKVWRFKLRSLEELEDENPDYAKKTDETVYVGTLFFSRCYFNQQKNKGIIFASFNCGNDCGSDNMLFVRKYNDKWEVIRSETLSVY